jgi:2-keto-4-pentenoate hydratase/2-oxohepta-3-ene-1,7-dioic acid hydratase in catechol pathway
VNELIAYLSSIMTLEPGDIIFSGTPAGIGALMPGDTVEVEIEGLGKLTNPVVAQA